NLPVLTRRQNTASLTTLLNPGTRDSGLSAHWKHCRPKSWSILLKNILIFLCNYNTMSIELEKGITLLVIGIVVVFIALVFLQQVFQYIVPFLISLGKNKSQL